MRSVWLSIIMVLAHFFVLCNDPQSEDSRVWLKGVVQDLSYKPLPGVSVTLTSSGRSVTTDPDGSFSIDLTDNPRCTVEVDSTTIIDTLIAVYEGYISEENLLRDYTSSAEIILWKSAFRLTDNEISGWVDQPDLFISFDSLQLYNLINGGADVYFEYNAEDGIFQALNKGEDFSCDVFIYNCVSSENAESLFNDKTEISTATMTIPGYDRSNVLASDFLGGAMLYVHWNKFFLEISLSGYSDLEVLKNDASQFLSQYSAKIGVSF